MMKRQMALAEIMARLWSIELAIGPLEGVQPELFELRAQLARLKPGPAGPTSVVSGPWLVSQITFALDSLPEKTAAGYVLKDLLKSLMPIIGLDPDLHVSR
jgi:hypothetical protein